MTLSIEQIKQEYDRILFALTNADAALALRNELTPVVNEVVDLYDTAKEKTWFKTTGAWVYFDKAMSTYLRRAEKMLNHDPEQKLYLFDQYFRWYVKQGIVEAFGEGREEDEE